MLDSFMKVACSRSEKLAERDRLVERMKQLPDELLLKIASGEEKLGCSSYGSIGGLGGDTWLDRFKGTPLFEQALELEKQDLQEQMAEKARYREEDAVRSARNASRDEMSVQRRLLELQLVELDSGMGAGEPQAFAGEETPEEEALEHGPDSPAVMQAAQAQQQPPPAPPKEEPPAEKQAYRIDVTGLKEKSAMKLAYAKMKMAGALPFSVADGARAGAAVGAIASPALVTHGALNDPDSEAFLSGRGALRGGAAALGGAAGAAGGGALGVLASGLPGTAGRLAPLAGMAGGGALGAYLGAKAVPVSPEGQAKQEASSQAAVAMAKAKADEINAVAEEPAVQPGMPAQKVAFIKAAIGLGLLANAAGGAAKAIGGGGLKAFQSARGFGASVPQAARMGAGAVAGQAPGALKTLGRAAGSYAKANPLQAAGLAGAAGLGAGVAMS